MDGEQTIQAIRSSTTHMSSLYCIALTASNYRDQRKRLLNLGFDAFLSKPASLQQLSEALSSVPQGLHLDTPMNNPFSEKSKSEKPETSDASAFDFSYLKSQFGDAYRTVFAQIAPSFLEHAYNELEELEAHCAQQKTERVRKTSHSMKGAASSIGLTALANVLVQIEKNPSDADATTLIEDVRSIMTQLKPIIEREIRES